jgi:iron complex outermembrane receptor protein
MMYGIALLKFKKRYKTHLFQEAEVKQAIARKRRNLFVFALIALLLPAFVLRAQDTGAHINGIITDAQGKAVVSADVTVTNAKTGATKTAKTDSNGAYSVEGLSAGTYSVSANAIGFAAASKSSIVVNAGQTVQVGIALGVNSVMQQIEVNAGVDSIAAQAAPSGGFLDERTPQSLVSNTYIENFTSPIADFGELVQIVPGAFTTSSNGIGLGQSKTYFRAFSDGEYNIDFDGIPYYDTNTPTHHSWAFFPSQWIGGIDFDRSPGTASTIGPTPFGGSMHQFSKPLSNDLNVRGTVSYGTWNTKLYDGAFNSGNFGFFGGPKKSNIFVDVHHMDSQGYQSFNFNQRDAGSLLYQYTFSPHTVLTGFSGVVHLFSNGPNISSSRCMMYGVSPTNTYSCTSADTANGLQPFTGAGIKFLMTDNSDPVSWFDNQYNTYAVPTDFEYIGIKSEFGKGWYLDVKPYTYNYDNGEKYSNATPITELTSAQVVANPSLLPGAYITGGAAYYLGTKIAPCNVQVDKKNIYALPCGIDKYNSYRKYGEVAQISQTSTFGVFRAGMWYEWARTKRHQYPSDPLNNWADQPLPKFNETFWTNSYQPYAEYEFHVTPRFNITPGVKFAGYTFDILHYADDGSTVGNLGCASTTAACPNTITDTGSFTAWLPSLDLNYRIQQSWSAYAQVSTGSVVPPSAVYDYNQTAASANAAVPVISIQPKQQKSTAYQVGTVYKAQRFTIDADAYLVRFQSGYSSTTDTVTTDPDYGDTIYYLQPSSTAKGLEFESTAVLAPGLNLYLNGTAGTAFYRGELNANLANYPYNPVYQTAPSGLWVQQTPTDTETQGLSYSRHGFDLGIFNKRIGEERMDNGQYHNQAVVAPFSTLDGYLNYTIRNHSIFNQTKIRLGGTNLLDSHNVQTLTLGGSAVAGTIPGNCNASPTAKAAACTDQFNATTAINGQDEPSIMAGRSFSVAVTFGFSPKERK